MTWFLEPKCNNPTFQSQNNGYNFLKKHNIISGIDKPISTHYRDTIHTQNTNQHSIKSGPYTYT